MMSGKRNNFVDSVIVELKRSGLLGSDERKLDPSPGLTRAFFQDQLDPPEDQFLGWSAFTGGTAFQAPIDRIWNVNGRAHELIVPYLWLEQKHFTVRSGNPNGVQTRGACDTWVGVDDFRAIAWTVTFAIDDLQRRK